MNKTRRGKEEFLQSRIPGSSFFDVDDISDKRTTLPHMLPSEKDFEEHISSMGISSHHHVIVYAAIGSFSAPRVWWTFKAFGHDRVSVLDGGLPAWISANGPIESGTISLILNGRMCYLTFFKVRIFVLNRKEILPQNSILLWWWIAITC